MSPAAVHGTLWRRIGAFAIDTVFAGGICAALAAKRQSSWPARVGLTALLASTLGFLYHVALEGWRGQTVGKRVCGLVVVRGDGTPCSFDAAFRRTAGRLVDWLPFGYVLGLLAILASNRNRRLGDVFADTVVVRVVSPDSERD